MALLANTNPHSLAIASVLGVLMLTNKLENRGQYELIAHFNDTIVKEDSPYIYRVKAR